MIGTCPSFWLARISGRHRRCPSDRRGCRPDSRARSPPSCHRRWRRCAACSRSSSPSLGVALDAIIADLRQAASAPKTPAAPGGAAPSPVVVLEVRHVARQVALQRSVEQRLMQAPPRWRRTRRAREGRLARHPTRRLPAAQAAQGTGSVLSRSTAPGWWARPAPSFFLILLLRAATPPPAPVPPRSPSGPSASSSHGNS